MSEYLLIWILIGRTLEVLDLTLNYHLSALANDLTGRFRRHVRDGNNGVWLTLRQLGFRKLTHDRK